MADDKFSLKFTAVKEGWLTFGDIRSVDLNTPVASIAPSGGLAAQPKDRLPGLDRALDTLSADIGLLVTSLDALNLTLSSQRLRQAVVVGQAAGAKWEPAGGQKGAGKAGGIEPPNLLKPAISMDSAMADLGRLVDFQGRDRQTMAVENQRMAALPQIAAGGTKAVDLVRIEYTAAKAGIGSDQGSGEARQKALLAFANAAAITATAFKMSGTDAGEMMAGWRTSMKLSADQAMDLADATNHLGKAPGDAEAADIGAILQRHGGAATSVGLAPAQAAALTAALLNSDTSKADAGSALKNIATTLGKGDQATTTQQAAWKALGLDSGKVAGGLREDAGGTVASVLQALNRQPAEKRSTLATALFAEDGQAVLRLAQNLDDVKQTFSRVAGSDPDVPSESNYQGSVRASALAQSKTQKTTWDTFEARTERLSTAVGNALAPVVDSTLTPLGELVDGLSELAETFPKVTAGLVLLGAALRLLVSKQGKAVVDEVFNRGAKRILDGAGARQPGAPGPSGGPSAPSSPSGPSIDVPQEQRSKGKAAKRATKKAAQKALKATAAVPGAGSSFAFGLSGSQASVRSLSRRAPGPAKYLGAAVDVAEGLVTGDTQMLASGLGTASGGWAGASAGAALGGAIGSVVPIIGTALGAAVGGLFGGYYGGDYGASLGDKLGALVDRLSSPEQVKNDLVGGQPANPAGAGQAVSPPITFAPVIQISGPDQASSQHIADLVLQQLRAQFIPLMMTDPLAVRRGAALSDGGV
ncbi:phage tail tape measure protein, TP901 family, core region [Pseudomonas chlororaphis]|uniref:phage tail tape measure protein n=1 Tax=Pseudomonas chlororaphis TaxID=587753 RepID=UPI00087CF508|nr:phage tail tape measure protein [Pseudomonas chlororaphis]AZD65139.1 Phage protein [Pseudomonas chlororaphis subsp. aurantiaca]AZD71613.1 Phage protein [Pseudomonas chlororaphis subsp. aurantiaca]QIT21290.1 phage tail tape measure protein [Pseudomonas chlororaphis subsp. aurantiaca]WDH05444.1 phage tail tape measure protein [Pseudomonas chlororaphis]WDH11801.1 phage tail tape measure protein [Pseudomonas chlororaphis]